MNRTSIFEEYPYLKRSFLFYVLLGVTDTVHHLHAAVALGHSNALHAFWTGIILIPIATFLFFRFLYSNKKYLLWGFYAIAGLAALVPGIYHGGRDHLIKILGFARVRGHVTDINLLFPADNYDLWFYEITGALEFILAALLAFFLCKSVFTKQRI